jgi:uncharacterized RmlC-like cupin family protein
MGLKNKVDIVPLNLFNSSPKAENSNLNSIPLEKPLQHCEPETERETAIVNIPPGTIEDLFVHRYQTDRLIAIKGNAIIVVLQNRRYQYILMSESEPTLIEIPPGIPHAAINLSSQPCTVISSIIRHGPPHERDYRPLSKKPFPYNLDAVRALTAEAWPPYHPEPVAIATERC